jgi:hypothetical protein
VGEIKMLEAFRNEIVEAEKGRIDLLKWKLILIAGIGTIGLGLGSAEKNIAPILPPHLLLCLIPLVCVYVDSLCQSLQTRILVISEFFQHYQYSTGDDTIEHFHEYERFCNEVRREFHLEDWAQQGSTVGFSLVIFILAVTLEPLARVKVALLMFCAIGLVLTVLLEILQKRKHRNIKREAYKLHQAP